MLHISFTVIIWTYHLLEAGRGPPKGPAGKLVYTGGGARPPRAPPLPRPLAPPRVGAELLAEDEEISYMSVMPCT